MNKNNQAPKYKKKPGFHPVQHTKANAYRRAYKLNGHIQHRKAVIRQANDRYKKMGQRLRKQPQVYYDDKEVAQYAMHHSTSGEKTIALIVIIIILLLLLVGIVQ